MSKCVEVKSCSQCIFASINFVEFMNKYDNVCKKMIKSLETDWKTTTPNWCPLPDYKELK